jgi:hypothetical protein
VKKIVRKRARPAKPPSTLAVETAVDVIEEAVPGVITVTEFEETEVREPSKGRKEAEENGSRMDISVHPDTSSHTIWDDAARHVKRHQAS